MFEITPVLHVIQCLCLGAEHDGGLVVDHRLNEPVLIPEVVVQLALARIGCGADVVEARPGYAALADQCGGGGDDSLARGAALSVIDGGVIVMTLPAVDPTVHRASELGSDVLHSSWTIQSTTTTTMGTNAMSPTIQEQSDQLQAASAGRLPAEVAAAFARDRAGLRERGKPVDAVSPGDLLEDFTLPDVTGKDVSLSELVADGPAVLVFYRGGWCPFCNLALHQYQAELVPQLSRFPARMVAISPQAPDESLSTAEKHALQFPVLSDAGARVARQLGVTFQPAEDVLEAQRALGLDIRETNAEGATELPMPTVVVDDRDRVVRFADVHPDCTSRTEVQAIISALADF